MQSLMPVLSCSIKFRFINVLVYLLVVAYLANLVQNQVGLIVDVIISEQIQYAECVVGNIVIWYLYIS